MVACRLAPYSHPRCTRPSIRLQASAQASLTALVASVGAAASLDRPSRRAFGKALIKCIVDLRGAVNVR